MQSSYPPKPPPGKACGSMTQPALARPSPPRQERAELWVRPCACAAEAACMLPLPLGLSQGPAPDQAKETQDQRQPPPKSTVLGSQHGAVVGTWVSLSQKSVFEAWFIHPCDLGQVVSLL